MGWSQVERFRSELNCCDENVMVAGDDELLCFFAGQRSIDRLLVAFVR
jgi:hypothetical protein